MTVDKVKRTRDLGGWFHKKTNKQTNTPKREKIQDYANKSLRHESRSSLRIVEDAMQPVCHGSPGLQALAIVVNGLYTIRKYTRDALEILLHTYR